MHHCESPMNELIAKHHKKTLQKKIESEKNSMSEISELQQLISQKTDQLGLTEINALLDILSQKKKQFEETSKAIQNQLLYEFLTQVRQHKQEQLDHLNKEVGLIDEDNKRVEDLLRNEAEAVKRKGGDNGVDSSSVLERDVLSGSEPSSSGCGIEDIDSFNKPTLGSENNMNYYSSSLRNRRRKMQIHFDDLEQCYFTNRAKSLTLSSSGDDTSIDGLMEFTETLNKFTMYSSLRPLATLLYTSDPFNGSSIVSSIEFDKDNEFFAIAGVTKKIKLFEYSTVVKDTLDIHYPITEMECNSKISCVSWSSYFKSMMASSDYEGTVTVWDAFTNQKMRVFQEHEKRCWSVDFNKVDTKLISSGSDDAKVKLWSTDQEHSVTTLEAKANVCCVKFNPTSRYHVAFGSADHCVHYYDLRNYKSPLIVFKGHKKAVSYVKFLNKNEIVSASTDSQLKLWNTVKSPCQRSFKGHINEKNFVGLATDGDYVACGSENNSLYVYYKGLSKHALTFWFDSSKEKDKREDDTSDFVSAVCWRLGTNVVVAANSQGIIKVNIAYETKKKHLYHVKFMSLPKDT
ncbi:E3 ubiquitin-protein ligase RFWD2-like isoform X1 [Leptotrombidium deliense]|uniref:E3 ubiquitin-protein ligase RFWD2-like isoform X1 n=1 Tax=Leptotrombidium deliense TaxID=299467 RepID=A0A443SM31_9ACAR|nr:E3 ubiquitin-protein ligase RFWD2-like isoform X1 [Leptotrombidium deliense]